MGKLLVTRNGSPYPLVTRGKRTLSSKRHEDCAALGGLAHEHGSDADVRLEPPIQPLSQYWYDQVHA